MLSCLVSVLILAHTHAHKCIHEDMAQHFVPSRITPTNTKTDDGGVFKIQVEFLDLGDQYYCNKTGDIIQVFNSTAQEEPYTCREQDVLTAEKENYIRTLILDAVAFWESVITLADTNQFSLTFSGGSKCFSTPHTNSANADSDYVLYVAFQPTSTTYSGADSTLAWALTCTTAVAGAGSFQNGRPVAGYLNMGPTNIQGTTEAYYYSDIDVAKHELAHALGFARTQFPSYLNSSASPYPANELTFQATERGVTVTKIKSPNVLDAVRVHFNCSTLDGAELENGGGSGTALSHWEARLFNTEFMIGFIKQHMYVSNLTLALFDDMGWYKTNRSYAEPLLYGEGEGCSFAREECSNRDGEYFCSASTLFCEAGSQGCTIDRRSKALCDKTYYGGALPTQYQYFSQTNVAGQDQTADYCPYFTEESGGNCLFDKGQDQWYGEILSLSSRCFKSTVAPIPVQDGDGLDYAGPVDSFCNVPIETRCHKQECLSKTGEIVVFVSATDKLKCPRQGGNVDIHDGVVEEMGLSCSDSDSFEVEAGKDCAWLASNDENCLTYGNVAAQSACPLACKTCAAYQGTLTCPPASEFGCDDTEPPIITISSSVASGGTTYEEPVVFTITTDEPLADTHATTLPLITSNCAFGKLARRSPLHYQLSCAAAHNDTITVLILANSIEDANGLRNEHTVLYSLDSVDVTAPVISFTAQYLVGNTTDTSTTYQDNDHVPTNSTLRLEVAINEEGEVNITDTINCVELARGSVGTSPPSMYVDCGWQLGAEFIGVVAVGVDADNASLVSVQDFAVTLAEPVDITASGLRATLIIFQLALDAFDPNSFSDALAQTYSIYGRNVTVISATFFPPDGVLVDFHIATTTDAATDALRAVVESTPTETLTAALSNAFNLTLTSSNPSIDNTASQCVYGLTPGNSETQCSGTFGVVCNYTCIGGLVPSGAHVCGENRTFSGGACVVAPTPSPEPEEDKPFYEEYFWFLVIGAGVVGAICFCVCWYQFLKTMTKTPDRGAARASTNPV